MEPESDDALTLFNLPPGLALVLCGLKAGWSPAFYRLGGEAHSTDASLLENELQSVQRAAKRMMHLLNRAKYAVKVDQPFVGWFPPLASPAIGGHAVSRIYLLVTGQTLELNQILEYWTFIPADAAPGSLDSKLNEHMGKLLGYPVPWRPARTFLSPKEGQREFQGFLWCRRDDAGDGVVEAQREQDEGSIVREELELLESYGFLSLESQMVREEVERRRIAFNQCLRSLGMGGAEAEIVDLRGPPL